MKCLRILSIINGLLLSSNVAATTPATPLFSPYVDLTVNTYWDAQQDIEPIDLGKPGQQDAADPHQFLQELYPEKIPQVLWQFIEVTPMIGVNNVNTTISFS